MTLAREGSIKMPYHGYMHCLSVMQIPLCPFNTKLQKEILFLCISHSYVHIKIVSQVFFSHVASFFN